MVGGGLTGLVAALRLQELGVEPLVFESEVSPGGMIATFRQDGWWLELGCATLVEGDGTVGRLLNEAIPSELRIRPVAAAARRYLVHQGALVEVPDTPAKLVATPMLSLAGRMRLLREPFVARGGEPEETVASFARRRFGAEMARAFFEPLLAGSAGGDPEQLLARYTLPRLVEHERRAGSVLKGRLRAGREARRLGQAARGGAPWSHPDGLAAVPAALVTRLSAGVKTGTTVTAVEIENGTAVITDGTGGEHRVDAVLMAVGAPALGRIAFGLPGGDSLGAVAAMPHASLVVVGLGFRRAAVAHPLDGRGVLAAASEQRRFLAIQFTSSHFTECAPAGHVALTVTLGGARHPTMVSQSDQALVAIVQEELQELLGVSEAPVISAVQRWPAALPLAVAGHPARIAAADEIEGRNPRLAFAGAWRDGIAAIEGMAGGVAAANRLVTRLGWGANLKEEVQ